MRFKYSSWLQIGSLFLLLGMTLMPFYMMIISSVKYKDQMLINFWGVASPLHIENYKSAFFQIYPFIVNSIVISSGIAIGVCLIASLSAFAFVRFDFPGRGILFTLILSLMMIPGFLLLIPQFLFVQKLGMLNTFQGQIFPPMAYGASMATLLIKTFFEGLPNSLIESAELEGAGDLQILMKVIIPLSLPVLATVAIINFLAGWNNYIWPLVSTTGDSVKPVILALSNISASFEQGISVKLAGYVIASIPLVVLFMAATKPFIAGVTSGAVKG